jgi:hypothetical protein
MNRTLTEGTGKTYHDQTHQQLKAQLQAFLMTYNFAKRLECNRFELSYATRFNRAVGLYFD